MSAASKIWSRIIDWPNVQAPEKAVLPAGVANDIKDDDEIEGSPLFETRSLVQTCITNAWVALVALCLFYLSEKVENNDFYSSLSSEIGIAFLVSYIIIISIEYRSRLEQNFIIKRFLKGTHQNLFRVILGVQFPPRVFDLVRDRLMKEAAYRVETEVHFTIYEPDEKIKLFGVPTVRVDCHCSYTLVNLSDQPYNHTLKFFIEEDEIDETNLPFIEVGGRSLGKDEIKEADDAWKDQPGIKRFEYSITLDRKKNVRVRFHTKQTRLVADTLTWRSLHPCDNLRTSITFPEKIEVMLDSIHPDDIELIDQNDQRIIAQISRPLFPGNGMIFWWRPRHDPSFKGQPASRE